MFLNKRDEIYEAIGKAYQHALDQAFEGVDRATITKELDDAVLRAEDAELQQALQAVKDGPALLALLHQS